MKRNIAIIIIIIILLADLALGSPALIYIQDVNVMPQIPTVLDIISIDILGSASSAPSWVEYSEFSQNETSLLLDLYVDTGYMYAHSYWSFSEQIGPFDADSYSLTVRAFEYSDGTFKDFYTENFVVIPEPATLFLLSFGGLFLKRRW